MDPANKDYLAFTLLNHTTGEEIGRFRADDFAQMRSFMVALGATGQNFFSPRNETGAAVSVEATHGLWDVIHPSEDELAQRELAFQQTEKKNSSNAVRPPDAPPSYATTIQQLPIGFYFPEDMGIDLPPEVMTTVAHPGAQVGAYDPSAILPKSYRREWHDTFRPPLGPPVFFPVSIGYGAEIGLPSGMQALWDPIGKYFFFLDHTHQLTFFEDPRPAPVPRPIVQKQQLAYGDRKRSSIPLQVCRDLGVVQFTSSRAHTKPHGYTLLACGQNGRHGFPGQPGFQGGHGFLGQHGIGHGCPGSRGGDGGPGGPGANGERGVGATEASDVILTLSGGTQQLQVSGTSQFVAQLGDERCEEVLFMNCRGGDGGNGGRGGDGGKRGDGARTWSPWTQQ